ncbi:MAG TPA: transglycosylase SLT domain-containing protein [Gammaproteobacteria bacterium]|nr:transglycosylase SLT domain-containing protein [Gammaproteobacteria bacterium]
MNALADRAGAAANEHELPPALVIAIVATESGWNPSAWRVEPPYRYLWDNRTGKPFRHLTHAEIASEEAPSDFHAIAGQSRDTEWWGQQASWGLMQVMGAVARQYGFKGPFPVLCGADAGLAFGCIHLHTLAHHYKPKFGWAGVVAAYNAGSPRRDGNGHWVNQHYVDTVAANGAGALIGGGK